MESELYYIVSTKHTRKKDKYITFWRENEFGYTWFKNMCGIYISSEAIKIHHVEHGCIARKCAIVDQLWDKINYDGYTRVVVENNDLNLNLSVSFYYRPNFKI